MTTAQIDQWWSEYQSEQQRMALLAAGPVAEAINGCRTLFSSFAADLEVANDEHLENTADQEAARQRVWARHAEELRGKQVEIEQRMRDDLQTPE